MPIQFFDEVAPTPPDTATPPGQPRIQFFDEMGQGQQSPSATQQKISTAEEVKNAGAYGVAEGLAGMAGLGVGGLNVLQQGADWATSKVGLGPDPGHEAKSFREGVDTTKQNVLGGIRDFENWTSRNTGGLLAPSQMNTPEGSTEAYVPQTNTGEYARAVGQGAGAGAVFGPAGILPSIGGSVSSQGAKDAGLNEKGQMIAGLVGSLGTSGLQGLVTKGISSLGAAEKPMANVIEKATSSAATDAESVGQTIQSGAKAARANLQSDVSKAFGDLNTSFSTTEKFIPQNFINNSSGLGQTFSGTPLAGEVGNQSARAIAQASEDTVKQSGGFTWKQLQDLRSEIGSRITSSVMDGKDVGELKTLYAGLTDDMRAAATSKGTDVLKQFETANATATNAHQVVENVLAKALKNGTPPETIYKAYLSPKPNGSVLNTMMSNFTGAEREVIKDHMIARMGMSPASDTFSPSVFTKNYNGLSDTAKSSLFGSDKVYMDRLFDVTKYAKVAENFAKNGQVFGPVKIANLLTGGAGFAVGGPVGAGVGAVLPELASRLVRTPLFLRIASAPATWGVMQGQLAEAAKHNSTIAEFMKSIGS